MTQNGPTLHAQTRDGKLVCIQVTRPDTHAGMFCVWKASEFSAVDEFDGAEEDEQVVLTLKFMTDEEFVALGDFEGW